MSERQILILESKTSPQMKLTPEIRESIGNLKHIPGFQYLLQELALQRAYLSKKLESEPHEDLRIVDRLQNGIYWTNWLEGRLAHHTQIPISTPIAARQLRKSESDLLADIRANITLVGEGEDSAHKP